MSGRWPGWRTLPGIEIAPLAEKARAQGGPWKQSSYVWDAPARNYVSTCGWQVDADGTVSPLGEGWEAIVEDGMLTGFRGVKGGTIEELVQISALVVPEGDPPWTPSLTVRLPPEQIGMFRDAEMIVGPHGAGLSNIMFSAPGTRVMEFMPLAEYRSFFADISDKLGHVHAVLPCPTSDGGFQGDMTVDIGAMRNLLGQLEAWRAS